MKIFIIFLITLNFFNLIKCFDYNNLHLQLADYSSLNNFKRFYEPLKNGFINLVEDLNNADAIFPNVSQKCLNQTLELASGLINGQPWATQAFDSFGKSMSGLLQGALFWTNQYDECLNSKNSTVDYYSQSCNYANPTPNNSPINIQIGLCMPDKCSNRDIAELISFAFNNLPANISSKLPFKLPNVTEEYISCEIKAEYDASAIFSL